MPIFPREYNTKLDELTKWYNHPWVCVTGGFVLGIFASVIASLIILKLTHNC